MFLTDQELADLTGRKRPTLQAQWLASHGFKFEVNAAGRPRVLRSAVEQRLGGPLTGPKRREPNLVPERKAA